MPSVQTQLLDGPPRLVLDFPGAAYDEATQNFAVSQGKVKAVRAFKRQGYDVRPVHPTETTIEGLPVYRSIGDVPGPIDRVRLTSAVDTLRRLGVPCAGIVMSEGPQRPRLRALL